jgi:hypothetical protein
MFGFKPSANHVPCVAEVLPRKIECSYFSQSALKPATGEHLKFIARNCDDTSVWGIALPENLPHPTHPGTSKNRRYNPVIFIETFASPKSRKMG